jgi:hypothetical protein
MNPTFKPFIAKKMTPKVAKSKYGKLLTEYVSARRKQEAAPVQ